MREKRKYFKNGKFGATLRCKPIGVYTDRQGKQWNAYSPLMDFFKDFVRLEREERISKKKVKLYAMHAFDPTGEWRKHFIKEAQ